MEESMDIVSSSEEITTILLDDHSTSTSDPLPTSTDTIPSSEPTQPSKKSSKTKMIKTGTQSLDLPQSRIRGIMTLDPTTSKRCSKESVRTLNKATQLFLSYLGSICHTSATSSKRKGLRMTDLSDAVETKANLEFLLNYVRKVAKESMKDKGETDKKRKENRMKKKLESPTKQKKSLNGELKFPLKRKRDPSKPRDENAEDIDVDEEEEEEEKDEDDKEEEEAEEEDNDQDEVEDIGKENDEPEEMKISVSSTCKLTMKDRNDDSSLVNNEIENKIDELMNSDDESEEIKRSKVTLASVSALMARLDADDAIDSNVLI